MSGQPQAAGVCAACFGRKRRGGRPRGTSRFILINVYKTSRYISWLSGLQNTSPLCVLCRRVSIFFIRLFFIWLNFSARTYTGAPLSPDRKSHPGLSFTQREGTACMPLLEVLARACLCLHFCKPIRLKKKCVYLLPFFHQRDPSQVSILNIYLSLGNNQQAEVTQTAIVHIICTF